MISLARARGPFPRKATGVAMMGWVFLASSAFSYGDDHAAVGPKVKKSPVDYHSRRRGPGVGTLGYGPPGLYPGFQGFGLGYHLGYGYGGDALGPGAEGGYPLYGGPGYPNCDPRLWRFGGINPFPYNGGPGYPTPDHPNYFGMFGPLVVDQPVIKIADDPGYRYDAEVFGPFTGGVPNPEAQFAQFTARAAAGAATMRVSPSNSPVPPRARPRTPGLARHRTPRLRPPGKERACPDPLRLSGSTRNRSSTPAVSEASGYPASIREPWPRGPGFTRAT